MHLAISQYKFWLGGSVNRRILSAAVLTGTLGLLVKIAGLTKELAIAEEFGVSGSLDAFLMAFLIPAFVVNVIAGALQAAFMPTYIHTREHQGESAAHGLLATTSFLCLGVFVLIGLLLAVISPQLLALLASGFTLDTLELCESLFYLLLPFVVLSGMTQFWEVVLNANEHFGVAAIAHICFPLSILLCIWLFAVDFGVFALVYGVLLGALLQAFMLMVTMHRKAMNILPVWHGMTPELRQVLLQFRPMVIGGCLMSGAGLVDSVMAAMLGAGSVSVLSYGTKVPAMIIGITSMALGRAVFPFFSKMVAQNDWHGVRQTLKYYTKVVLLLMLPLSVMLFYSSEFIVRMLFERGLFNADDTQVVAQVQAFSVLQIPFYMLSVFFSRLVSSFQANTLLMWGALLSLGFNVILNYALMIPFGVSGIALSTSIVYLISSIYLAVVLLKELNEK